MNGPDFTWLCNYVGCEEEPRFVVKVHRRSDALLSLPDAGACWQHLGPMVDHYLEDLGPDGDWTGIGILRS